MSNSTLNKPTPNDRYVTNGQPASGLVRVPQSNESSFQRFGRVENSGFNNGIRSFYRQLVSLRSQDGKLVQTLGVTSCYQREGKSTVADRLASIAAESQRVLFIDASEPLLLLHTALRDVAIRSVAAANDTASVGQARYQASTDLRQADGTGRQPTIDETRDLLRLLSKKFELIVLDLPSLESTKVLDWAPLLDGVVLVMESGRARWQAAAKGIEFLEQAGSHVLGAVINKQREYIPQWLYQRL
jgi:Mrp family chromosome partitioning ATPase